MSSSTRQQWSLKKEELLHEELKFSSFHEFELFVYKESKAHHSNESNLLKTFAFKSRTEAIKLSFLDSPKKNLLKKIIDENCDSIYNARLRMKKKMTLVNFDSKIGRDISLPTFHNKLILFLFLNEKEKEKETTLTNLNATSTNFKRTISKNIISVNQIKPNYAIEALAEWRLKEENMDKLRILEKECEIIKQ